jgi:hypothetical protein
MNLQEINLGEVGQKYVSHWLGGGTGLCPKLAKQLERGEDVFAPMPPQTSRERAMQFGTGGLMSWRETCVWFEREIQHLSARTDRGTLVFQDVWASPRHPVLGEYQSVFFDQSGAVYYILGPDDINAAAISLTMSQVYSFLLVAVFCNFSFSAADVPATRILDETLIDGMANNAQEVFVSAYDREGLVVWRRPTSAASRH